MFIKGLQKLTFIRKCKYGRYKILKKIDKKIFTILIKKTNKIKVLKKVSDKEFSLFCTFKKGFKRTNKSKYGAKGVLLTDIKDVFFDDYDDQKMVPFYWCVIPKSETNVEVMTCGSFINEVCINEILKAFVPVYADYYCQFDTAWKSKRQGNIILEYGGKSLCKVLEYLNLKDLKCIVFQVLTALAWGQKFVHLKHHDLHTENIFIQLMDTPSLDFIQPTFVEIPVLEAEDTNPIKLKVMKKCETKKFLIPQKYKIKLADFGFSCATNPKTQRRSTRADYDLMDHGSSKKKWGDFNENLYGNEGYDMLYFLDNVKDEVQQVNKPWVRSIIKRIQELNGKNVKISSYSRPLDKCKVSPYQILTSEFFDEWSLPWVENA